jgi:hypothetical protein
VPSSRSITPIAGPSVSVVAKASTAIEASDVSDVVLDDLARDLIAVRKRRLATPDLKENGSRTI